MDQKNTIVKCNAHPNCLFNYNGVCDNYVINIGADGKCESYIETEWLEQNKEYYDSCFYCQHALHEKNNKWLYCEIDGLKIDQVLRSDQCKQFQSVYSRGQRAKCDFINDGVDQEIINEVCKPFDTKPSTTAALKDNLYDDTTFNLCSSACHYYDFKGACLYCQLRQKYLGPERLMKPCDLFVNDGGEE